MMSELDPKYSKLAEKAVNRLSNAPNLSGIAGPMTALDRDATLRALILALRGGWADGLLALVLDVSFFLECQPEFYQAQGNFNLSEVIALLMDVIRRNDFKAISDAIAVLKKSKEVPGQK